ncbi:hypothetical protein ACQ4PT_035113 [Festuca glaucescens]
MKKNYFSSSLYKDTDVGHYKTQPTREPAPTLCLYSSSRDELNNASLRRSSPPGRAAPGLRRLGRGSGRPGSHRLHPQVVPRDAVPVGVRAEPVRVRRRRHSPPRSPQELARAALSVSADRAKSASAYVGRLVGPGLRGGAGGAKKGGSPASDCLENMADSVGHLRDAAKELGGGLGRAGTPAFRWHLSNVQTWCSAALTDENTCLDGLSRGVDARTRAAIRSKVVDVAQVTSNALALVNKVGAGH